MSRTSILNIVLGVICIGLLSWLYYLETSDEAEPAVTTTTSTAAGTTSVETATSSTTTSTTITAPTTSTTGPTTSTTAPTTSTTTVPPTTEVPIERFFVGVLVVNGTTTGQRLEPVIARLSDLGYFDVRGVVGAVPASETVIYHADGYAGEAEVVATDLGFEPGAIELASFADAPPVSGRGEAKVIVYLGPNVIPEPPVTEGE